MAAANTVESLNGLFKEVYADNLADHRPKSFKLQNHIDFITAEKRNGNNYNQPIQVAHEHGFTYSGPGGGAFTLGGSVAGGTKNAQITGSQRVLQSQMDYESAARASTGGKRAFVQATSLLVREMTIAFRKRQEIDIANGRQGIGIVGAVTTDGSPAVVTITDASWVPGVWAGAEGAEIAFGPAPSATVTLGDGAATLKEMDGDKYFTVASVDMGTKKITLDRDTASSAGIEADDAIYFRYQRVEDDGKWNIPLSISDILASSDADTDDSLFGIPMSASSLWKPNKYDRAADGKDITFEDIMKNAVILALSKGLEEDLCMFVSPKLWATLVNAEVGKREWNSRSYKVEVGPEEIQFYSQHGTVKIIASLYIPDGKAFLIAPDLWLRIGATDMTFNLPGRGDEFFLNLESSAAIELRAYDNTALFTEAPGKSVLLTGAGIYA